MKSNFTKYEIENEIDNIFLKNPSQKEIKKVKKLAMSKNIKLNKYKKKFCKKCFSFFNSSDSEIRIKRPFKIIRCKNCGYISRYKL